MYNSDHLKVMKALASLPKNGTSKVRDIKKHAFKAAPNDRVVRNALRKPVKNGLIELVKRGEYRLTKAGTQYLANPKAAVAAPTAKTKKIVARMKSGDVPVKPNKPKARRGRPPKVKVEPVQDTASAEGATATITF
jgi:DNA-binding PadR family transcriptional regulator